MKFYKFVKCCIRWIYFKIIFSKGSSGTSAAGRAIDIRLRAFENILQLLNIATQLGIGPKLNDLAAKNENDPLTTTIEDDTLHSPTQPLGALRKVKTKSVAVQTSISNRVRIDFHSFEFIHVFSITRIPFHIIYKLNHRDYLLNHHPSKNVVHHYFLLEYIFMLIVQYHHSLFLLIK
jgi:hypothetical protein